MDLGGERRPEGGEEEAGAVLCTRLQQEKWTWLNWAMVAKGKCPSPSICYRGYMSRHRFTALK